MSEKIGKIFFGPNCGKTGGRNLKDGIQMRTSQRDEGGDQIYPGTGSR